MLAFVEKIWIYFDDNEDSYINLSELLPYLRLSYGPDLEDEEAEALFKVIDITKRSLIVKQEMITFFNKLFQYLEALKKGINQKDAAHGIFGIAKDDNLPRKMINKLFEK